MEPQKNQILPRSAFLDVSIKTPDRIVFQGQADAVSSYNEKGPFDVLFQHGNFISIISKSVTLHLPDKSIKEFPVESGVIQVFSNKATILLGIKSLEEKK